MRTHCQLTHLDLHCLQVQLFLCLALYGFNLSIYNLFALLQIFIVRVMRNVITSLDRATVIDAM